MLRGNLVYAGCQWGMIVTLAKVGTPEMLGKFSLASAITTPVFMLANLQLRTVQATDATSSHEFHEYFWLRAFTTCAAALVITAICLSRHYVQETALVIVSVAVWKGVDAVAEIYQGCLQRHERMDLIAKSLMYKGSTALVLFTALIWLMHSILFATIGLTIASVVVLVSYDARNAAAMISRPGRAIAGLSASVRIRKAIRSSAVLAWLTLPLGIVMGLVSLNVNLPRYFIANVLGEHELGIFAALAYVIAAANTLIDAMGQAASPRLARHYADRNVDAFRRIAVRLVAFGAMLGAATAVGSRVAGGHLLALLYTREYAARADVFELMLAATPAMFAATFLGCIMTAARYFLVQIPLLAATTCVTAVMCAVLLRPYGLRGVAMALLISAVIQATGAAAVVRHAYARLKS